jgi:hypothetical protein
MKLEGELYKQVFNTFKGLRDLGINYKQRKELVKESYSCLGYLFGFSNNLNNSIKEAKEKNLSGEKAYSFLTKKLEKYDNETALKLSSTNAQYELSNLI